MRILKLAVISVVVLFVLLLLMGLLLPSRSIVSRAIDLPAPAAVALPWLSNVNRWSKWMQGLDSFLLKQQSDSVFTFGKTEIHILQQSDTLIQSKWISGEGYRHLCTMRLIPSSDGQLCTLQWQLEQEVGWVPWERLGTTMHEKILGPQMEINLEQLRQQIITGR